MAAETGASAKRRIDPSVEDEFSYSALVNRWRRERSSTTLTRMDDRFYEAFDQHIQRIHEEYQREQAVAPATPKVLILLDELTNLQRVRDDLYEIRERKIATAAVLAARDGRIDRANMTREEEALFEGVLRVLAEGRRALLRKATEAAKPAGGPPTPPEPLAAPVASAAQPASLLEPRSPMPQAEAQLAAVAPAPPPRAAPPAEAVRPEAEPEAPRVGHARVLVRVTRPVEPFVAPDLRHYKLQAEDVAALPRDVAHLLVSRGLAVALSG